MATSSAPTQPAISDEAVALGKLLLRARGERSLRQIQERCGTKPNGKPFVSLNTLSLVERGRRGVSAEMLDRIVHATGADGAEAFRLAGQMPPKAAAEVIGPEVSYALEGEGLSERARKALRRIHLERLAEDFSGFVVDPPVLVEALLDEELEISCAPDPSVGWARFTGTTAIGYAPELDDESRTTERNFMLAHMAAHVLIARDAERPPHCSHDAGGRPEKEATWMAGVILLPRPALETRFQLLHGLHLGKTSGGGLEGLLAELAGDFGVPLWLAMRHAGEAGHLAWAFREEEL